MPFQLAIAKSCFLKEYNIMQHVISWSDRSDDYSANWILKCDVSIMIYLSPNMSAQCHKKNYFLSKRRE